MFVIFAQPGQLVKEDTPESLVLHQINKLKFWGGLSLVLAVVLLAATLLAGLNTIGLPVTMLYAILGVWLFTSRQFITIDIARQKIFFSTRLILLERTSRVIPFSQIDSVYLDYEENTYPSLKSIFHVQHRVWRKWFIFLTLSNAQTVTVARHQKAYPLGEEPNLFKETQEWEKLATKICAATDKLLIRTPSVPGHAPHTFVDIVDQIVQRRLAQLPADNQLADKTIRLRSHPTGSLEIVINGKNYRNLGDIPDTNIQGLIQSAVQEWHGLNGSAKTSSLFSTNASDRRKDDSE